MTTRSEDGKLQRPDGSRVHYRRWLPDGDVRGTVHVVHGASEHSGRYSRLAGALTARGLAVYAMDLRGHGRTAESTGIGRFGGPGVDAVLGDIEALHLVMDDRHPEVPRVLLGHSMGSVIALAGAERNGADLAGLVLSGPIGVAPHLAASVDALEEAVAAGAGDHALDALGAFNASFEPARTRYDWLSRDPAEVDAYIADPLCGDEMPLTAAYAAGVFALAVRAATPDAVAALPAGLPVLLLSGELDPVGGADAVQVTALAQLFAARGLAVEQHVYPEARHEVFNEINRDEVVGDLLAWLEQRVPALGG
ncbi:alpha-beta hydrolase superfamily lysophospholipase [Blastococcus colisei]|uniref:Alpha-beta hydrolase superfamily lysophospholipase n=1 Tax=Blastococcus colisei TaxID=1564162 RepID=A0A543PEB8_9ACTN|nr:alpha/beta hydrolase [Blastococcus colisei]TQN42426.1 alpha-beta hydrolase superfamily lysophospholipase [Blastococcus colisei]